MRKAAACLMAVVLGAGCSVSTKDSDSDDAPQASPVTQALFAELPAATPDKLRGVWALTSQGNDGDAEVRLRFSDGKIVGGVRCTTNTGEVFMMIGGEVENTSEDLDAKSGTFTMASTLQMSGENDKGQTCNARFDASTWNFVIAGTNVAMTSVEPKGSVSFQKVGD